MVTQGLPDPRLLPKMISALGCSRALLEGETPMPSAEEPCRTRGGCG